MTKSKPVKVRPVGNSNVVTIPKDLAGISPGDYLVFDANALGFIARKVDKRTGKK